MNDMPNLWGEKPGRRRGPWRLTLLIAALVVGVLALLWRFPYAMANGGDWASLGYMLALLVMVSAGFAWQRPNLPKMFRHAVIWVGVAIVIGMGYAYRFELSTVRDRFLGELVLGQGQEGTGGEIRFRVGDGGHFRLEAFVNDLPVQLLVDTGASDVVLAPADAVRLGFDLSQLNYSRRYRTANGIVKCAPVELGRVRIGPIEVRNVRASVNGAPLGMSLLGVSFLERLSGYSVENGTLTLRR